MSLYDKFIRKAKERIATRKLTLTEVGAAVGLSTAQVRRVLNGAFRIKGDNLLRMAMFLEISLDKIIFPETDLVVNSMTMAQGLAGYGVPEEEILQGIRNSTNEVERAKLTAAYYNKKVKHVRDLGYDVPDFPVPIEPEVEGEVRW